MLLYILLSTSTGPAEGWPLVTRLGSSEWLSRRNAAGLIAISMALGIAVGGHSSISPGLFCWSGRWGMVTGHVSAADMLLVLFGGFAPVSISQTILAARIGTGLGGGLAIFGSVVQLLHWLVSPAIVYVLTLLFYLVFADLAGMAKPIGTLEKVMTIAMHSSLVIASFWRRANFRGVLASLLMPRVGAFTALAVTAILVGLSTIASIRSHSLGFRFAFPPDPFPLASIILAVTSAVSFGLFFGIVSSYSQLIYSSQLYLESRMLGARSQTARKFILSFGPAVASLVASFVIVVFLGS